MTQKQGSSVEQQVLWTSSPDTAVVRRLHKHRITLYLTPCLPVDQSTAAPFTPLPQYVSVLVI